MNPTLVNKDSEHKIFGFISFSKKNLLIIIGIWYFGTICNLLAWTDLLTESPFQRKYILMISAWLFGTVGLYKTIRKTYKIKLSVELK